MKINWKAVPEAFKVLGKLGEKHLPTILTGLGVAGFIGTAIMAAKAAPKAESAIKKAEREKFGTEAYDEPYEKAPKLTVWEKTKVTAGYYWPSVALGAASTACVLSAHKIDLTRLASVTAAYQLSKKDFKELKDKIVEKDGEEKYKEYTHEINQDHVPSIIDPKIYNTGRGSTIFQFGPTGTMFYGELWHHVEDALRKAVIESKREGEYPVSEVIYDLGLPNCPAMDDYVFFYDSFEDIDEYGNNLRPLFDYCSCGTVDGDSRACIVIDVSKRMVNRRAFGGSSFQ